MQLSDLRNEVLAHGFDSSVYGTRITQYINDAQNLVARRIDYHVDENVYDFSTAAGTSTYAWPADMARIRSLRDTSRQIEMQEVGLRMIDRSSLSNGAPAFYAFSGQNLVLYPTPDNVYPMELRYWVMPPALVNDSDVPTLPSDWHHILWVYATWMCYEGDDDAQMGQYWQQRFNQELSMLAADQKFPSTDYPTQASGMWDSEQTLTPLGWTYWGGY